MKGYIIAAFAIAAAGILAGCAAIKQKNNDSIAASGYTQITQEEAKEIMEKDDGHIIVDVRRQDEYAEGHIPDAICIPNETIGQMQPAELPDLDQVILIYCRSGNRSKQASQKLSDIGYSNIYEFGGIIDWTGDIVTEDNSTASESDISKGAAESSATLSFDSFDGGGYAYTISLDDPELVSYTEKHEYSDPDHGIKTGSSYDVIFSFTGLKAGETEMTVTAGSPIIPEENYLYKVMVDNELNVTITELEKEFADVTTDPYYALVVDIGDTSFFARLEDNPSANELIDRLLEGPIEMELSDYGGFEKVGDLPWPITSDDTEITTVPGDVILYQGNKLTIYYDENTWSFTKLGHIDATKEELLEAMGDGDVKVSLSVEYTE